MCTHETVLLAILLSLTVSPNEDGLGLENPSSD